MNVFTFSGNLGRDAEVRQAGQQSVCGFSVAVKAGHGEREQTLWLDCSIWGKRAEGGLPAYLTKGQQVVVSGELSTREHEGKTYLSCNVREISLVGGASVSPSQPQQGGYQQPQQQPQGGYTNQQQPNPQAQGGYANQGQQPMNQQQPNPQQWQGQQQGMNQQQGQQHQRFAQQPAQNQSPAPNNNIDDDIPF